MAPRACPTRFLCSSDIRKTYGAQFPPAEWLGSITNSVCSSESRKRRIKSIQLPALPNEPYFTTVETNSQVDLGVIARLTGMEVDQLHFINPGYTRWTTDPNGHHHVLVPVDYDKPDGTTGKTLLDALVPAWAAFDAALAAGWPFAECLARMAAAAEQGRDSTRDLVARVGRASRLGERSRGVLDAGATSCALLLQSTARSLEKALKSS